MPWKAEFFPTDLDSKEYLSHYSRHFDFVELNLSNGTESENGDSSSYGFIGKFASAWSKQTPDNFRFAIRIPTNILFDTQNGGFKTAESTGSAIAERPDQEKLGEFLQKLVPIKAKVLALKIYVPPHLALARGREWLESLLLACTYHGYSVALQFGHNSWYQDLTYNILKRHRASIIWQYDSNLPLPRAVSTTDFFYFRPTNNQYSSYQSVNSTSRIITNDKQQFQNITNAIEELVEEDGEKLKFAIIVAGHPIHADIIREMLGLAQPTKQSTSQSLDTGLSILRENSQASVHQNNRIIAHVDLNAFYPSCEELRNPSLKGKAHAVIMTDQKEGEITKGVVSSCSYEARKHNVRSAMGLSRAKILCPDLILLPVDIPYYGKVSEQVMSVLEAFSDVLEQSSIDEAFLDCTNKLAIDDNSAALVQLGMSIKAAIKQKCGLLCSVGIAPTKSAAKIASDFQKPDGLTVIVPHQLKSFLLPLEVSRVAGIGQKTEQALREMGITTLGELAAADVQTLQDRFGKNGLWMWKAANGSDFEPVRPRGDHVSVSTETTLETYTRDRNEIHKMLSSMADELYERAVMEHGYSFRTIGLKLVRTDFTVETRETSLAEKRNDKEAIISVMRPLLERFSFSHKEAAVRKAGLRLTHLSRHDIPAEGLSSRQRPPGNDQKSLFDFIPK